MTNVTELIETLLEDNWDNSNTDFITPQFVQIVDSSSKKYDYNTSKYMILIHRPLLRTQKNGCDTATKMLKHLVRLDLRVLGKDLESTYIKMYEEIIRILDVNIVNPFTGFQELDYEDKDNQDLSDKNKGLFRVLIPVHVINYCILRGS